MNTIVVAYWMGGTIEKVGIPHNSSCPYTKEKRNEIIDKVLDSGYNVLLQQQNNTQTLIIWIDDKRFQQR